MRSGNVAYISIHSQLLQVKHELEAERSVIISVTTYMLTSCVRNIVTRLQDVINRLTSSYSTPTPPTILTSYSTPGPAASPTILTSLVAPDVPDALDEEDYPNVPYWRESDWMNHAEQQKERGRIVSKLGFLTGEDGSSVTEFRIKQFMSHAKHVWNELYRSRLDPCSWTKKTQSTAAYFENDMKVKFQEFRLCEGNWKVERFAIIKYPDWCRDARESGRLTRACILPLPPF